MTKLKDLMIEAESSTHWDSCSTVVITGEDYSAYYYPKMRKWDIGGGPVSMAVTVDLLEQFAILGDAAPKREHLWQWANERACKERDSRLAHPAISRAPEPSPVFTGSITGHARALEPARWVSATNTEPEKRFPTYEDGLNSERLRILAAVMNLEPRKTSIQRGAAEAWKADGAREMYERVLAVIGGAE